MTDSRPPTPVPPPTGTVTFLFTDIEGSTRLWQAQPEAMALSHARHDAILREAIEAQRGFIFQLVGDAFCAAFPNAADGLRAALAAQRRLQTEAWGATGPLKVRMGLHSGAAEISSDGSNYAEGYTTIASAQRVMSVAHGGQVLLSEITAELLKNNLPENIALRDLGEHRLKDLRAALHLYQLAAPDLPQDFPPIKSLNALPNNLPIQLTTFIGREKEIADIKRLLKGARLVTLTGSGGTGKTRLTQEVGAQRLESFPGGVWFIELAPLSDPAQIIPALAQVFGLQELPFNPLAVQVLDYLRDKTLLLILDNCEHLISACARLANDLLHQCAGLTILASSREALGIAGEAAYRLPSLAESESSQLFVERARAANSNFKLTAANTAAIAQICRRLDGIPLAIELAAARVKLLAPDQLASRLDDRFRLLVGGSRTALPRQQTLRALIDWSYDLLTDEEKRLLQFASVFVGGWTLEALEAVADDPGTLELLEQLVNKSLVVSEEHETEMRYFMLETIRQYAREKLFDAKLAPAARDRHFAYFDQLSVKLWDSFQSAELLPLVSQLELELDNFRVALEWGLENHVEQNLRLAANFCLISSSLGLLVEGVNAVHTAIERTKALPPAADDKARLRRQELLVRALWAEGTVGMGVGDVPQVYEVLKEAIAIARSIGNRQLLGYCLGMYYTALNYNEASTIDPADAEAAVREELHIFTDEVKDSFGLGMSYLNMARLSASTGADDDVKMYFGKLNEMIREMPKSFQVGMFYLGMGMYESTHGNLEAAKKIFADGVDIFNSLHHLNFSMVLRSEIGHIERHTGHLAQARAIYHETLKGWQQIGNRAAIAHQLECFAFLALGEAEPQRAARLFGAAEVLRDKVKSPMLEHEQLEYDQHVASLHALLPAAEFDARWAEGRSLSMAQAIQLALS